MITIRINIASDTELLHRLVTEVEQIIALSTLLVDEDGNYKDPEWADRLDEVRDFTIQLRCDMGIEIMEGGE